MADLVIAPAMFHHMIRRPWAGGHPEVSVQEQEALATVVSGVVKPILN